MAVDPTEIELFQTNRGPVQVDDPVHYRWLLHNFGAIKARLDSLQSLINIAPDNADILALQAEIDALEILVQNIQLTPGPKGDTGDPGEDSTVPGPIGPAGPSGTAICAPVLAVPDGWQITNEMCETVFVGL